MGCAQFAPPVNSAAAITPTRLALWYGSGRSAHGAGQLGLAAEHYEKVLSLEPGHVGALNALAVIQAQQGHSDQAIALFARARQLAPGAAHIYNNAGYALMRAGRLEEAEPALKRALELDPHSVPTRQNLALLAKAQAERGPVARIAQVLEAAQPGLLTKVAPRLVRVGPQVYSLELPARAAAQVKPELAIALNSDTVAVRKLDGGIALRAGSGMAMSELKGVRLEVSNGVGIARLARRTADRLALAGVATARLTNALPYLQASTEVQFAQGQEAAAQALQSRLPLATRAVASGQLPAGMQLRLVLGHDASGQTIAAWFDAAPAREVSAAAKGGWRWS